MWQALVAEFAHPHLVDRLMWPSPLGTGLASGTDRCFRREFHKNLLSCCKLGTLNSLADENDEEMANIAAVNSKI